MLPRINQNTNSTAAGDFVSGGSPIESFSAVIGSFSQTLTMAVEKLSNIESYAELVADGITSPDTPSNDITNVTNNDVENNQLETISNSVENIENNATNNINNANSDESNGDSRYYAQSTEQLENIEQNQQETTSSINSLYDLQKATQPSYEERLEERRLLEKSAEASEQTDSITNTNKETSESGISDFLGGLGGGFAAAGSMILNPAMIIPKILGGIKSLFTMMFSAKVMGMIFKKILPQIGKVALRAIGGIPMLIVGAVIGAFKGVVDGIVEGIESGSVMRGILEGIRSFLNFITFGLLDFDLDAAENFVNNAWDSIKEVFGKMTAWFSESFGMLWEWMKTDGLSLVTDIGNSIWNGVKGFFTDMKNQLMIIFDEFGLTPYIEKIGDIFSGVIDFYKKWLIQPIMDAASGVGELIGYVADFFANIKDFKIGPFSIFGMEVGPWYPFGDNPGNVVSDDVTIKSLLQEVDKAKVSGDKDNVAQLTKTLEQVADEKGYSSEKLESIKTEYEKQKSEGVYKTVKNSEGIVKNTQQKVNGIINQESVNPTPKPSEYSKENRNFVNKILYGEEVSTDTKLTETEKTKLVKLGVMAYQKPSVYMSEFNETLRTLSQQDSNLIRSLSREVTSLTRNGTPIKEAYKSVDVTPPNTIEPSSKERIIDDSVKNEGSLLFRETSTNSNTVNDKIEGVSSTNSNTVNDKIEGVSSTNSNTVNDKIEGVSSTNSNTTVETLTPMIESSTKSLEETAIKLKVISLQSPNNEGVKERLNELFHSMNSKQISDVQNSALEVYKELKSGGLVERAIQPLGSGDNGIESSASAINNLSRNTNNQQRVEVINTATMEQVTGQTTTNSGGALMMNQNINNNSSVNMTNKKDPRKIDPTLSNAIKD